MIKSILVKPSKLELQFILLGILAFVGIIFVFKQYDLSVLQSDPYMYLQQSKSWWLKDLHLPAYAFILWCVNTISLGLLQEVCLLHLVAGFCWLASVLIFIAICKALELEENIRAFLLVLYAYFPLIGLTFATWPLADSAVWLIINLLVLSCIKKDWNLLTISLAIGLLLHKVVWGFSILVALYALVSLGFPFWGLLVSALPFVVFWAAIVLQGSSPFWMVQHDIERHFPSYSALPIFDGIIGTILQGTVRDITKGTLLLIIYVFELCLFFKALKCRNYLVIAILAPLLILGASVNQWLAIAVLRFGKISIVAAALLLATKQIRFPEFLRSTKVIYIAALLLICSQLLYATKMKDYFIEGGILDKKLELEKSVMESKGLPVYERGESE